MKLRDDLMPDHPWAHVCLLDPPAGDLHLGHALHLLGNFPQHMHLQVSVFDNSEWNMAGSIELESVGDVGGFFII